jgi:hypothetical protein
MKNKILAFLFGDSQVESEIDEASETLDAIMEEAEELEPLQAKKTPLAAALKAAGVSGDDLELGPEGLSLAFDTEEDYREACEKLMEPDAMEALAQKGWVALRQGDKAMSGEVSPEYRIRFVDLTTPEPENKTDWPAPNPKMMADIIKKGREFATTPFERDPQNPVTDMEPGDKQKAGVGKEKDGADPEGKPKGTSKSEAQNLVDRMLNRVNEGGHKAGCTCGFCKNKGRFGKKKEEEPAGEKEDKGGEQEDGADAPMKEAVREALARRKGRPKAAPSTRPVAAKPKTGGAPGKAYKTPRK